MPPKVGLPRTITVPSFDRRPAQEGYTFKASLSAALRESSSSKASKRSDTRTGVAMRSESNDDNRSTSEGDGTTEGRTSVSWQGTAFRRALSIAGTRDMQ